MQNGKPGAHCALRGGADREQPTACELQNGSTLQTRETDSPRSLSLNAMIPRRYGSGTIGGLLDGGSRGRCRLFTIWKHGIRERPLRRRRGFTWRLRQECRALAIKSAGFTSSAIDAGFVTGNAVLRHSVSATTPVPSTKTLGTYTKSHGYLARGIPWHQATGAQNRFPMARTMRSAATVIWPA